MDHLVSVQLDGPIAHIAMDDGKVNVMSLAMQDALHEAFDVAEAEGVVTVLSGRTGVLSAGFDLLTLGAGGAPATAMVRGGFELAERVLRFPLPVIIACTGHAIAMGAFLLLSGDHRVGADGPYRLTANEAAIGLTMPHTATEILRQRLTPAAFNRAVTLAAPFSPTEAVVAGFLDDVVEPAALAATATAAAIAASSLDMRAHAASKLRARGPALQAIREAILADAAEFA